MTSPLTEMLNFFKAMADETRIRALAMLTWHEELCVCDFEAALEITQSKASRHLRYMQNMGLLVSNRRGIWIYYRINPALPASTRDLLDAFSAQTTSTPFSALKLKLDERLTRRCSDQTCS